MHKIVNKIYDDFEVRVCKNCIHYSYIDETFKKCNTLKITITDDWFCGDFYFKGDSNE